MNTDNHRIVSEHFFPIVMTTPMKIKGENHWHIIRTGFSILAGPSNTQTMTMHQWDQNRVWQLIARKLAHEASQDNLTELNELKARYPEIEDYISIISGWWNATERMGRDDADRLIKELMKHIEEENKLFGGQRKKKFRFFRCLAV